MWSLFERLMGSGGESFKRLCVTEFKGRLAKIIGDLRKGDDVKDEGILVNKNKGSRDAMFEGPQGLDFAARYCTVLKKFTQLFDTDQRHAAVQEIVLQESNFVDSDANCIALKIFCDICLEGGMAFDVSKLFQGKSGAEHAWLAFIMLNIGSNAAMACLPQLKR